MDTFITVMDAINGHRIITFAIIVAIGLIWICFQIPTIKAKTAPPNGVKSSRDEWIEARKSMNQQSFIVASIGIGSAYLIWIYEPHGAAAYFLHGTAAVCFLSAAGMQFLNKKGATMRINNQGDSK